MECFAQNYMKFVAKPMNRQRLPKFSPAPKHKDLPSLSCPRCMLATVAAPDEAVGPGVVVGKLLIKLQGTYYMGSFGDQVCLSSQEEQAELS